MYYTFFYDKVFTSIRQGTGGLLKKANNLAMGALIAAAL